MAHQTTKSGAAQRVGWGVHADIVAIQDALHARGYVASPEIGTSLHLARHLGRPLLIEGPAGVGKTEIAKVMAALQDTQLVRLQCYEGLDAHSALYEWNYQKQLLHIRLTEGDSLEARERDIFGPDFLLERPLLKAITASPPPVLLIDEVDRADEAFEAFLLELLSDWQLSIPELGTLKAETPPLTLLTSNRSRELSDALRRRCLYLWIDYPSFEKELAILRARQPELSAELARRIVAVVQLLRRLPLEKTPGVAESLDWAAALTLLHRDALGEDALRATVGALLKHPEDQRRFREGWLQAILGVLGEEQPEVSELWLERAFQRLDAQLS
jgi:MoxR-like ATPase